MPLLLDRVHAALATSRDLAQWTRLATTAALLRALHRTVWRQHTGTCVWGGAKVLAGFCQSWSACWVDLHSAVIVRPHNSVGAATELTPLAAHLQVATCRLAELGARRCDLEPLLAVNAVFIRPQTAASTVTDSLLHQ